MRANRKIVINQREIDIAIQQNAVLVSQYDGQRYAPQVPIPEPEYILVEFSFRTEHICNWYIEPNTRDILVNIMYEGKVRFDYDPTLDTQLGTIFSV